MKLLFRNKKRSNPALNEAQERIAGNIVHRFLQGQKRGADWMQDKAERLPGKGKLAILLLFCLLAGGYSIYLVIAGIKGRNNFSLSITSIRKPTAIPPKERAKRNPSALIETDYLHVHRFKEYMDSLTRSEKGTIIYDSIVKARPGLMDSVLFIENIYQSQFKN